MTKCNWNNPGSNPFRGNDISLALDNYNFNNHVKSELEYKISKGYNDYFVEITKDSINTSYGYASNLRDMHFTKTMCKGDVDRSAWKDSHTEQALVYCSGGECVAVPVVCGNISRIDYIPKPGKTKLELYPEMPYNTVSEPNMLWLILTALVIYMIFNYLCKVPTENDKH